LIFLATWVTGTVMSVMPERSVATEVDRKVTA